MHPAGKLLGKDAVDKPVSCHTAHAGKRSARRTTSKCVSALAPPAVAGMLMADVAHIDFPGESASSSLPAMVSAMVMCYLLRGGFVCLPAAGVYDGRCYETPLETRGQDPRQ